MPLQINEAVIEVQETSHQGQSIFTMRFPEDGVMPRVSVQLPTEVAVALQDAVMFYVAEYEPTEDEIEEDGWCHCPSFDGNPCQSCGRPRQPNGGN